MPSISLQHLSAISRQRTTRPSIEEMRVGGEVMIDEEQEELMLTEILIIIRRERVYVTEKDFNLSTDSRVLDRP